MLNFIKNISPTEIAILVLILVVLFGSRVVTRLGKASGETVKEIKKIKKSFNEALDDDGSQKKEVSK